MKTIEVDDELYRYIASQTENIGESASDILRRLLMPSLQTANEKHSLMISNPISNVVTKAHRLTSAPENPMYSMQNMLNSDEFTQETRAVGRFMLLLTHLYEVDNHAFSEAAELKGRKRIYFSKSKEVLLASGQTSKPKQIPNTPYWVITNTNTGRKQQIIQQIMEKMGFQIEFIERVITTIQR